MGVTFFLLSLHVRYPKIVPITASTKPGIPIDIAIVLSFESPDGSGVKRDGAELDIGVVLEGVADVEDVRDAVIEFDVDIETGS